MSKPTRKQLDSREGEETNMAQIDQVARISTKETITQNGVTLPRIVRGVVTARFAASINVWVLADSGSTRGVKRVLRGQPASLWVPVEEANVVEAMAYLRAGRRPLRELSASEQVRVDALLSK